MLKLMLEKWEMEMEEMMRERVRVGRGYLEGGTIDMASEPAIVIVIATENPKEARTIDESH